MLCDTRKRERQFCRKFSFQEPDGGLLKEGNKAECREIERLYDCNTRREDAAEFPFASQVNRPFYYRRARG